MKAICWIVCWIPLWMWAQPQVDVEIPDDGYAYVLGDDVALREAPYEEGRLIDRLIIGTPVWVHSKSVELRSQNGIRSHWYRVETKTGKTGWLWGGNIAQDAFRSQLNPEVQFVCGYERIARKGEGSLQAKTYHIRAYREGRQLSRMVLQFESEGIDRSQNLGPSGVEEVSDIIKVELTCISTQGCSSGNMYVFWQEGKFVEVLKTEGSSSKMGMPYETLIFPGEMEGQPPYILLQQVSAPKPTTKGTQYETETLFYRWNGRKVELKEKEPIRKTYWKNP